MTAGSGGRTGMRGARRRAIDIAATEMVVTALAPGSALPLLVTPAATGADLAGWALHNRARFESWLLEYGAVMFRGFGLRAPSEFETVAAALVPDLFGDYGDLPKEENGERIYQSTPYPADMTILFHNESSHLPSWPTRQLFFCVQPSLEGGNTPLLDCERVLNHIDAALVARLETKKLCYVRNFVPGVDVSWQDFFKTTDRSAAEARCAAEGMVSEWHGSALRVKNYTEAVRIHPQRGTRVFFNQVQLHHSSCLDPATRAALLDVCGSEIAFPRNVLYGDESPIADDEVAHLGEVFFAHCVQNPWQAGDIIALDNMRISHARLPYRGPRRIAVAMGAMHTAVDRAITG